MDNVVKLSRSNRYIIEDSIPKVTSDGEPHEIMTMVAVVLGLIAAVIVLIVLMVLIGCRQQKRTIRQPTTNIEAQSNCTETYTKTGHPIFGRLRSTEEKVPQLLSITTISATISANEANDQKDAYQNGDYFTANAAFPGITTIKC